jgi:hypothetical protein
MKALLSATVVFLGVVILVGCTTRSDPTSEELGIGTPEEVYAQDVRTTILDIQSALSSEGVEGAAEAVQGAIEGLEGYQELAGQYAVPIGEIKTALEDLQKSVEAGASSEVSAKVTKLVAMAERLPQ